MIHWLKRLCGVPEPKKSSLIAKERLMVIVAHERGGHEQNPDFLQVLQKEITAVLAKYVKIDADHVQVEFEQKGGRSVLELNVTLPEGQVHFPFTPESIATPEIPKPDAPEPDAPAPETPELKTPKLTDSIQ